jgi:hypothetical protein
MNDKMSIVELESVSLVLGVNAAAHHFSFMPVNTRYAATATKQIGRCVPATRRSRETLVEVLPRGRSHVRRGRKIGLVSAPSAGDIAKNLATPIGLPLWPIKACSDKPMQAICGVTGLVAPCVCYRWGAAQEEAGSAPPRFRTIQVCPKDRASALGQAERCGKPTDRRARR